jgi:hypothetical protein
MPLKWLQMNYQTTRRALTSATASVGLCAAATFAAPAPANAIGDGLWHCDPLNQGIQRVCTTFVDLPGGVGQVRDRLTNQIITVHNGDNVFIADWGKDSSGQCGLNGDAYVWLIGWNPGDGRYHYGFASDWYLNTGPVSNWNDYGDSNGSLGSHSIGWGSGSCDVIFPQYG